MASMFADVEMVNPAEVEAAGVLASFLRRDEDAMVVDTGARSEAAFITLIERLLPRAKAERVAIVVLRPLTLSSFSQSNAVAFVGRLAPLGVKVVLVKNLSQGRTNAHFADWDKSGAERRH